jgi:hypothetical protein
MTRLLGILAVALFAFGPTAARATITIDDFDDPQSLVVSAPGAIQATAATAPGAIGGTRTISLQNDASGNGGGTVTVDMAGSGMLDIAFPASSGGGAALFHYDGNLSTSQSSNGLGPIDLTEGGSNSAFRIFWRSDVVTSFTISVFNGSARSLAIVATPGQGLGAFTTVDVPFSSFTAIGGFQPASFTAIGSIGFWFDAFTGVGAGPDLEIDRIAVVPEPGTGLLLGLGMAALARRRASRA